MPYEQAVEELKVKLKSIRKEYRKRKETIGYCRNCYC